ncbi:MAG: DNA polymerase IV [Acutalibacteraceae bacterium]
MSERLILHSDLNNFFASVECFYNSELKKVPMAVCGSTEERHGIVLAKNEKAKKYGVKTAEAVWQAKMKCPELVIVEPNYDRYIEFSSRVRKIYESYTDLVEPFGIDECWLDVSGSRLLFGDGEQIADEIRKRVKAEIGITVSVGVSFNKIFAKLGSDLKKPDAVTVISKENFKNIVWPLPVGEMIGVGSSTRKKLHSIGVFTLGDLAACDEKVLRLHFGKCGSELWKNANGLDDSPVLSAKSMPPAKSFSRSITCLRDLANDEEVKNVMLYLADKVSQCLRESGCFAKVIQISVRDEHLITKEKQTVLLQPTRIVENIMSTAMTLFRQVWSWESNVRSVGICACSLVGENSSFQYNLFCDNFHFEKMEKLESRVEAIRKKYGTSAVFRAGSMLAPISEKEHPSFHYKGRETI